MAFLQISGSSRVEWYQKTASTALANGALLASTSGRLIAGTSTTVEHVGVGLKAVTSADSDYAATTRIPVAVPIGDALFLADATALAVTLENTSMDLTDSLTVNGAADSHHAVTLVRYLSATLGIFRINSWAGTVVGA